MAEAAGEGAISIGVPFAVFFSCTSNKTEEDDSGINEDENTEDDASAHADVDGDADSDSDGDGDTDSDTDADADADFDVDGDTQCSVQPDFTYCQRFSRTLSGRRPARMIHLRRGTLEFTKVMSAVT